MILFVKDLTVIDFSYLDTVRGIVGDSWIVDLELHGDLDHQSMVLDFGLVKKQIKKVIDATVDHKLAVPTKASDVEIQRTEDGTTIQFKDVHGRLTAVFGPDEAFVAIENEQVDFESTITFLQKEIQQVLPENVQSVVLTLRSEAINGFSYHYSHGLKKHDGNCQRIVHGHRSLISIYEDGMRSLRLEKEWAGRWEDIYLGSEEDMVSFSDLKHLTLDISSDDYFAFQYTSSQGEFELVTAKAVTEIIPHDTTVELLAQYIANELKQQNSEKEIKIEAYEGVGKGAIAIS
ncbi:6-carboxytetrahydropterin synthase [Algicola sagamiensis]|uniref:6-carboxytetrahydropterin synthase n=1 Tax=Algicola sagamiensis TaxID=163869 RepID=UPI00037605D3|nr:6-carboxytetrahydropterin synthase [Algicola sagamiensis]